MDYQHLWQEEFEQVIALIRTSELAETVKWGIPVFMYNKKNVVSFAGFKEHFAVWFYDGVFLEDKYKRLINASEAKTKALRQLRFTKEEGIDEKLILYYLKQAVDNAKSGKGWKPLKDTSIEIPLELKEAFKTEKQLESCFDKLPPFKQKEYCEYIAEAKMAKTKASRLEKAKVLILSGKGLHDRYR